MSELGRARQMLHLLIAGFLSACATGGGDGSDPLLPPAPVPPPASPPPSLVLPPLPPPAVPGSFPNNSSAEYSNNWGVEGINADTAWQFENAHGEGVVIGVIDDGIIFDHPELQGRVSSNSTDIVAGRNALAPGGEDNTHGAEIASIIAGNFNGSQTIGVAYESTILAVRADNGSDSFASGDLAAAIDYAAAHGVKVINLSLGSASPSTSALQGAIQRATAAGVIIVVSAGNDGPTAMQPNYPGFLATDPSVSNGLILIAGGTNPDGSFNTNSNPAGSALQSYLIAPGWEIVVPDFGPAGPKPGFQRCWPNPSVCNGLVEIQGTSYASPHVAAAIAILYSAFPGLTPQQVVQIILQSTDDTGATGTDAVTGRGRLNLARAFQPIGTVSAPLVAGGHEANATTPLGVVGGAFGDGMSDDPGEWTVAGFDALGRTYALDLSRNWRAALRSPALNTHAPTLWDFAFEDGVSMQHAAADSTLPMSYRPQIARGDVERSAVRIDAAVAPNITLSFASDGAHVREFDGVTGMGHLALADTDLAVRISHAMGDGARISAAFESGSAGFSAGAYRAARSVQTLDLEFGYAGGVLAATYGRVQEAEGLLGFSWSDVFGETPGGETEFMALSGRVDFSPSLDIIWGAEVGRGRFSSPGSSINANVITTAFSAEARLAVFGASDFLGQPLFVLSLGQPLRVEEGDLRALLPVATRYGRASLSYESRTIDPTPSGRELQLAIGLRFLNRSEASAFFEAVVVKDAGHVANRDMQTLIRTGSRIRF